MSGHMLDFPLIEVQFVSSITRFDYEEEQTSRGNDSGKRGRDLHDLARTESHQIRSLLERFFGKRLTTVRRR